ncbi:hypothetical protein L6164_023044 [Bauhinia variegata]|uniref:Uncharacterized protein n=1 Tax=Bauhinia variegata TaxID=167791 RepID=A0ACB9MHG8_BAUVA|nr:hypothetical protein L6164_023044 [Bauhinia variegata]
MVSIKASHTVIPSEPTPKGPFWLAEIDQLFHPAIAYTHLIYVYKPTHQHSTITDATEKIRDSLSKILVHYHPVAGRLRYIENGRFEVDCNAKGAILLEAESTKSAADYGDFTPNEKIRELVPMVQVDITKSIEYFPLLVVQVTRLNCGALCVGIKISHVLFDGEAIVSFINSWTKIARGEKLDEGEIPPMDRTVLKRQEPVQAPRFEHQEFNPLPTILGASDSLGVEESKKETDVAMVKLTNEQVVKLKNKANDQAAMDGKDQTLNHHRPYSRFESVAGYIWRCIAKGRQGDPLQPTGIVIIVDIRTRLKPPLPKNYFGNAVHHQVTPICHSGDIITKPLSYAASKIRESLETLTDEYLRSQHDHLTRQAGTWDWNRTIYRVFENMGQLFLGNPNMMFSSWMRMPLYDADFGWGNPVFAGMGAISGDGTVFILPAPGEDGSFSVTIRLQKPHLEAFKRFFYDDVNGKL